MSSTAIKNLIDKLAAAEAEIGKLKRQRHVLKLGNATLQADKRELVAGIGTCRDIISLVREGDILYYADRNKEGVIMFLDALLAKHRENKPK